MDTTQLSEAQIELQKEQLAHALDMHKLNLEQFQHRAKLEKLQALFSAREFANTIKNYSWGETLQKQIEQLTAEIYPLSKIIQ
jgi:hypothetical protein